MEPKSSVSMIVIKGAGGKAFCAGGDIKGKEYHVSCYSN